jgi:hypothetical protein
MHPVVWSAEDPVQSIETVGRHGQLRPDDGGADLRKRPAEVGDDRCHPPESASQGFEPGGKIGPPDDQRGCLIGRSKGRLNTKQHAETHAMGRRLRCFITTCRVSDYAGAATLLGSLPAADWLIAGRGYDADWFREALRDWGIRRMHPRQEVARQGRPLRQTPLQAAQPDCHYVRQAQGLAKYRYPLRQMRQGIPLRGPPPATTVMFWLW